MLSFRKALKAEAVFLSATSMATTSPSKSMALSSCEKGACR